MVPGPVGLGASAAQIVKGGVKLTPKVVKAIDKRNTELLRKGSQSRDPQAQSARRTASQGRWTDPALRRPSKPINRSNVKATSITPGGAANIRASLGLEESQLRRLVEEKLNEISWEKVNPLKEVHSALSVLASGLDGLEERIKNLEAER